MNSYLVFKHLHVTAVVLSATGFMWRGYLMLTASLLLQHRLCRILPHMIDTVLLASAIAMLTTTKGVFLSQPWLHAKLVGLLAYIVLGSVALKRGKTRSVRCAAYVAALFCLGWIASVAWFKTPAGIFVLLAA